MQHTARRATAGQLVARKLANVAHGAASSACSVELLHVLFVLSKGDSDNTGVSRRCGHRIGCKGRCGAAEIVFDANLRFHGAFMCPVCYMDFHLRVSSIASGPVFRSRRNQEFRIPIPPRLKRSATGTPGSLRRDRILKIGKN